MTRSTAPFRLVVAATCVAASVRAIAAESADPALAELEALLATPVYAASKFSQKLAEAPASVTVLTAGDIRTFGWRTLADILNGVRGVHVRNDQGYDYVGVRGLSRPGDYSSRVLLLIDGVRTNDNMYDGAMVSREFPLDVGLIERVEFISGPGSALYGSNAVFGVVNVITRSAANLRGDHVHVTVGTDGRKLLATSTREVPLGSLLLAATVEHRPGEDRHYAELAGSAANGGVATGLDAEDDRKVYGRMIRGEWAVSALFSQRTKQIPNGAYGAVFNDPNAEWRDTVGLANAAWHRPLDAHQAIDLNVGLGHYTYREHARYEPDGELDRYQDEGRWINSEVRWTLSTGGRHRLVAGAEVQRNLRQRTRIDRLDPDPAPALEINSTGTRFGAFVNDEITLLPSFVMGLGARIDKSADRDARATPRASLLWTARPNLVFKALLGSAFRDPNAFETREGLVGTAHDPHLTRERLLSRELAVDWRASDRLRLSASWYRTTIKGLIEQVTDETGELLVYRNVGGATARGVELEADYIGESGWRVRSSVGAQHVRAAGDSEPSNAPRHLFKWHGSAPLAGTALRAGLELSGTGSRLTLAGQRLPSYLLAHATVQYDPSTRPWAASFSVYNLGDVRVEDPAGPEHPTDVLSRTGRAAALTVSYRF